MLPKHTTLSPSSSLNFISLDARLNITEDKTASWSFDAGDTMATIYAGSNLDISIILNPSNGLPKSIVSWIRVPGGTNYFITDLNCDGLADRRNFAKAHLNEGLWNPQWIRTERREKETIIDLEGKAVAVVFTNGVWQAK